MNLSIEIENLVEKALNNWLDEHYDKNLYKNDGYQIIEDFIIDSHLFDSMLILPSECKNHLFIYLSKYFMNKN